MVATKLKRAKARRGRRGLSVRAVRAAVELGPDELELEVERLEALARSLRVARKIQNR